MVKHLKKRKARKVPVNSKRISRPARGGARPGSGRKPKLDKERYATVNVVLRKDTVAKLRAAVAPGRWYGDFLQRHLDRYPLPTRDLDKALQLQAKTLPLRKAAFPAGKRSPRTLQKDILRRFRAVR
jgi:hypothetical protein